MRDSWLEMVFKFDTIAMPTHKMNNGDNHSIFTPPSVVIHCYQPAPEETRTQALSLPGKSFHGKMYNTLHHIRSTIILCAQGRFVKRR
ncbi:hypothetical protein KM92DES2_11616 [uncultured Desulfovibrio sp.]|uniref:Uncharacterized protein n=1 Tax=uncultured Desulfovibrio sp. TaxID=167968 RepID=A0A212JS94_9BACT|nr:hypothetical protein KM92DES2_11616 [uncultured Desulfovibrio sp.]